MESGGPRNRNSRKFLLIGDLSLMDRLDEEGSLNEEGKERKLEVSRELNVLIEIEETKWRQKSRALWLKEKDRCTKIFHKVANSNRRNNSISCLEEEGETVEDPERIPEEIVGFFFLFFFG